MHVEETTSLSFSPQEFRELISLVNFFIACVQAITFLFVLESSCKLLDEIGEGRIESPKGPKADSECCWVEVTIPAPPVCCTSVRPQTWLCPAGRLGWSPPSLCLANKGVLWQEGGSALFVRLFPREQADPYTG